MCIYLYANKKIHQCECVYTCFFRWATTHGDMSGKYLEGGGAGVKCPVSREDTCHLKLSIHSTQASDMDGDTWSCIRPPLKLRNITAQPQTSAWTKGASSQITLYVYVSKYLPSHVRISACARTPVYVMFAREITETWKTRRAENKRLSNCFQL